MSLDMLRLLGGLCGAGLGLGLCLLLAGLIGTPVAEDGRQPPVWPGRLRGLAARGWAARLPLAAGAVAGLVVWLVTGWPVGGLLAAAAGVCGPRLVGRDREQAGRVARIEAVAGWAEMLRDTLTGAAGLEQAILATAPVAPPAVRAEVGALAAALRGGHRLPEALRRFADQLADETADLVVAALLLAARHEARDLAALLGTLAAAAREQAGLRLRAAASRARTRTSVRVISAATLGFAAGLVLFDRRYLQPYDSPAGQLVLLLVGGLFATGLAWLARLARIPNPPRLLTRLDEPAGSGAGEVR